MCLILFAYRVHSEHPLIVAANRDEFYERPTAAASIWPGPDGILAGQDLRAQGTWLGVTAGGRFAAVTNYRGDEKPIETATSRGGLVTGFLRSERSVEDFLSRLIHGSVLYQGYNLLVYDGENLAYASNRGKNRLQILQPGVYGLSNGHLNTSWPKVDNGRQTLKSLVTANVLSDDDLFAMMADGSRAPDSALPQTGVSQQWERLLSSAFIQSENYGTRCTTVVKYSNADSVEFVEKTHGLSDTESVTNRFQFVIRG